MIEELEEEGGMGIDQSILILLEENTMKARGNTNQFEQSESSKLDYLKAAP